MAFPSYSGFKEPSHEADKLLYLLYQQCHDPFTLFERTQDLINKGADWNYFEAKTVSPFVLLILHSNRGLRYHSPKVPSLERLESLNAPKEEITTLCQQLDADYQEQVYKCLELLLANAAYSNPCPKTCPAIPHNIEWNENYEHKIMQSEQRWNLLGFGGSMEISTYSIFNPLSLHRVPNSLYIRPLHLAAWRGDARVLKLLLESGARTQSRASDGRNALHFLYHYCNKPTDLPLATQYLIQYGADVNCIDRKGRTPLYLLLKHVFVKRSYVKYLANAYTPDHKVLRDNDHYRSEIKACVKLLAEAGADLNFVNGNLENPLQALYSCFADTLHHAEPQFQVKGHYLVPHEFKIQPLAEFTRFLLQAGCQIQSGEDTDSPLHKLCWFLADLSLDPQLNPVEHLTDCFRILLAAGLSLNKKKTNFLIPKASTYLLGCNYEKPPIYTLTINLMVTPERLMSVMEALLPFNPDMNSADEHSGTVLHFLCYKSVNIKLLHRLLLFLLRCGADSSSYNMLMEYPLSYLLRHHIHHHDSPDLDDSKHSELGRFIECIQLLCKTMTMDALQNVLDTYKRLGVYGVICLPECPVRRTLEREASEVRTLKHWCRLAILRTMKVRFLKGTEQLELPVSLNTYLYDLNIQ